MGSCDLSTDAAPVMSPLPQSARRLGRSEEKASGLRLEKSMVAVETAVQRAQRPQRQQQEEEGQREAVEEEQAWMHERRGC